MHLRRPPLWPATTSAFFGRWGARPTRHLPQATLAEDQMGGRWTGLIPGILRSSLLLPEALSLDWRLCFYVGPGEENLESQPHR